MTLRRRARSGHRERNARDAKRSAIHFFFAEVIYGPVNRVTVWVLSLRRECPKASAWVGAWTMRWRRAPRDGRPGPKGTSSFSTGRIDGIARRATGRDTRGSREDSSAVRTRTRVACCSWTRVEACSVDAREPSGGVSRRASVRFYLSFSPPARAARGPVVATAREARGRVARLGEARGYR